MIYDDRGDKEWGGKEFNYPKNGEIVVLHGRCGCGCDFWELEGYLYCPNGKRQSFAPEDLHPLAEDDNFAENVLTKVRVQQLEHELQELKQLENPINI